ncbi:phosphotransferase [Mycobacterium sp. CVI_P3]|uniref:Phosphotransferase n=1 Tax=Mycobacterium pinniadriaticum TaxID=2994102 RepID=A0ABT3SKJ7_9MYCO|nr:phosphotransferase [Mycobacterium pinniadriaticum]MCX2933659.1 phosphotransferase [Mycobacterium pinniadriaticum]MCX2940054.1 phosphotransferase [Mycobacterium pinniadriaticum]
MTPVAAADIAVPRRPADIDAATFRALSARTDVTAVRVVDENHGTALRARLEIVGRTDLPHTAFVKLAPVRPAERAFNRFMNLARNETHVYRLLGDELADIMPRAYGVAADRHGGRAIVIMEDLTERDATFPSMGAGATAAQAVAVAQTLGRLHQRFWMTDRFAGGDLAQLSASASRSTRAGPHSWHLLRTIPRAFNDIVPPEFRQRARMLIKNRWAIAKLMQAHPHSLIHGDTHLGNICFVDGRPILFDWQVASEGPAVKDLSYFACTSIETGLRRSIDDQLVDAYVDALNSDGITRLRAEEARDAYRLFAFTAYIAAGVTAAFGRRLQGEEATRSGLDRAVAGVRDLGSLELLHRDLTR